MTTNRVLYMLLVVLVAVLVGIGVLFTQSERIDTRTAGQAQIVNRLQVAERQRRCELITQSQTFAVVLRLLADNFATPPAPNPDRLKAVQGLRDAAAVYARPTPTECG